MKLTENFSLKEFECKCGCETPKSVLENIRLLVLELQHIRDIFNEPIEINSAYRCKEHNNLVGGSKNSQHLLGKAVDIVVNNYTPNEVQETIIYLRETGCSELNGIGRYSTFTHVDIRNNIGDWDFRK